MVKCRVAGIFGKRNIARRIIQHGMQNSPESTENLFTHSLRISALRGMSVHRALLLSVTTLNLLKCIMMLVLWVLKLTKAQSFRVLLPRLRLRFF